MASIINGPNTFKAVRPFLALDDPHAMVVGYLTFLSWLTSYFLHFISVQREWKAE